MSQIANRKLSRATAIGGLSVNLNHLKKHLHQTFELKWNFLFPVVLIFFISNWRYFTREMNISEFWILHQADRIYSMKSFDAPEGSSRPLIKSNWIVVIFRRNQLRIRFNLSVNWPIYFIRGADNDQCCLKSKSKYGQETSAFCPFCFCGRVIFINRCKGLRTYISSSLSNFSIILSFP